MSLCGACHNSACNDHIKHMNCVVSCWDYVDEKGISNRTMIYYTTAGDRA